MAIAIALGGTHPATAQVLYGSIVGNVTDANGAVVPSAAVTATNQETGVAASGTTNGAGEYNFVALQPGSYTIKVAMSGFKTLERRDLVVEANNVTRADVKLEVGSMEQSVTITGEAPELQTDRAETHADVAAVELENLPVPLGRNYQQLYRTLPGFSPPFNSHSIPTNPSRSLEFHVNGTSDDQNNTRIDGVSSTTVQLPHIVSYIPALESIQEVNVVTSSFDAEQGLAGGAAINVQIKSGTNELHGSAFEYHSDQHLKAWPESVPPGEVNKPKLVYNQFGGTIGGPIKKDKLFYFVSYEGSYDHRNVEKKFTVPTDAMKAGDFSDFLSQGIIIYNPYTDASGTTLADPSQRLPMMAPGDPRCNTATNPSCENIIPASLLNTPSALIAQKINALWPEPNLPGVKNNYFASGAFGFDRHTIDSKVNWNINEKFNVFGRFSFLHYSDVVPTAFQSTGAQGSPIGGSSNPGHGHGETYSTTFGTTYTFKPNFIMDAYFGFTKQGTISEQLGLGKNVGLDVLGIPGTNGARQFESGWPEFDLSGFSTIGNDTNFMPYYRHDPQYQYVVNFNWIHGKHNVRFGTDIYRQGLNQTQAEWIGGGSFYGSQGGFDFGEQITALCKDPPDCTTGSTTNSRANSYSSFLLGLPDQASKSLEFPDTYHIRSMLYSAYIRDRWNVTPRLTLDYGIRWEYFPYPTRTDRGLERYDPTINKVLICGMGQVPDGCGTEISKKRFSPRLGIAWRATNTFVIRAGYGMTNDPYEGLELMRNNYPVMEPFGIQTPNSFTPATTLTKGIPPIPAPTIPSSGILDLPLNVGFEGQPKNLHRGYIQSWNLTLQKELGWGFTGQAGYVGTRSIRQLGFIDINAGQIPFTNRETQPLLQEWGRTAATTFLEPLGTGHYDSLQVSVQRRFSKGLMLNANYTWGKSISFVDASSGTPNIESQYYLGLNRAPTGFDITHNLAITSVWDLPFGRGQKWLGSKGALTPIVSGWQLNNVVSVFGGTPFTVWGDCGAAWPGNSPTMTNLFGSPKKIGSAATYWYDPLAFGETYDPSNPGSCLTGTLGNSGYNNLRGPGVFNWDFGVFRDFAVKERMHIQFRAEAFNFTNTPHFCGPDNYLGDANAWDPKTGRVTDPGAFMTLDNGVCDLAREGIDERQFRLGIRFSW
ncbi:MAG TPA: TonB-dependent receptor [Bryobacteraceae bacterium]|nr:TonB-dependent receptor [Bryobacteraceae bacterium]